VTITREERKAWTREAKEAMTRRLDVDPSLQTVETAAWHAGFVAGWVALRTKLAGESPPGGAVPIGR
jgi:hypothetical protein